MKFNENTHIFTVKRILQERHGKMEDLKICFNSYSEVNEVQNEMLTLKECGLKGQPLPPPATEIISKTPLPTAIEPDVEGINVVIPVLEKIPTVALFYDFKPANSSDPVLLHFK
jgi:hypothetical protein